ncbi:MAG TPA: hypothetical protein VHF25_03195 [Nitriliruptorales bacterium]|nr:hypothetical protein [Nitriliruptorales bacterium]
MAAAQLEHDGLNAFGVAAGLLHFGTVEVEGVGGVEQEQALLEGGSAASNWSARR